MALSKEILNAKPRPGGSIKINEDSNISSVLEKLLKKNDDSELKKEEDCLNVSRRYKIKQVVTSTPWSYLETKEKEGAIKPSPKQNAMDLLSVTIGTIMCLATNAKCPPQNLKWTFSYLDLVKDEYGQNPPNVQGILNHIQQVAGGISSYLNNKDEQKPCCAPEVEETPVAAETAEDVPIEEATPEEEPEAE